MKRVLFLAVMATISLASSADCLLYISVKRAQQVENVPQAVQEYLETRLQTILTSDGISTDIDMSQFFIVGKFSHVSEDMVSGPPMQNSLHTYLTLYIGDTQSETIYSTITIELRGVGNSSQHAFINAMRPINGKNNEIKLFINNGRKKIIEYYSSNSGAILSKARRAACVQKYEEAIWYAMMIPECCPAYQEAQKLIEENFKKCIDLQGQKLLSQAQSTWSSNQNVEAAEKAFDYLSQINPQSDCFAKAERLASEIKDSIKDNREFELRQKYRDKINTEHERINAIREIGVAYAQQQQVYNKNIIWIK